MRWLISAIAAMLVSCSALTEIDAPDVIEPNEYGTVAGANALAAGAITLLHVGLGEQVIESGQMADELMNVDAGSTAEWDRRSTTDPTATTNPYDRIAAARQSLLTAIGMFQRVAPDSGARIGQLYAMLGFTTVFLGENFCAGVTLSRRDALLRPVYGSPLTMPQLFDSALTAFDSAMFYARDSVRITSLARVGRARALLQLGRFADAASAVAPVATTYVYNATYAATAGLNNVFFGTIGASPWNTTITIPEREGTNGINWQTANDPRVQLVNRPSQGALLPAVVAFVSYQSSSAPIRLAGGIEARLIEAEAALRSGDNATWLARLNALRALGAAGGGVNGLSPLSDPGTPTAREDLLFRERAFWLFLTGHRLGDLRRLVRQYGRNVESVFPTGIWRNGEPYGRATNLALPALELSNPNYAGCLNRDP